MPVIDNARDYKTSQYNKDIDALLHAAEEGAAYDRAAIATGLTAVCSVTDGVVSLWLYKPFDEKFAVDVIKKLGGTYSRMIAGKPAFLCDVNGDSVFILGE